MQTKEKKRKKLEIKITVKQFVILLVFLVAILYTIQVYFIYFDNGKTYGKEENDNEVVKISKAKEIDIDEIIKQNAGENRKVEIEKQEEELEYLTTYKTNNKLPKGMVQVVQEGRTGTQEIVLQKTYENDQLISEEQISAKVKKASMSKIVEVGNGNYSSDYNVKVGDTVYVTAERVSVMLEPNDATKKVASLNKGSSLKITAIQNDWYNISSNGTYGWVKKESTTYINPNEPKTENKTKGQTKEKDKNQLISKLNFGMNLNEPSGLSLNQFKKILTDDKDTKKVLQDNSQYFYYIESQYKINGVFVASMAIHESAWATSKIANDKKNLFGYGAYDSNPYNGAYNFSKYSESIDLVARVLVKYYLNPAGTSIYVGETASGKYYNGPTLNGVNTKYASDKGWANKVYNYMQYLYNKL